MLLGRQSFLSFQRFLAHLHPSLQRCTLSQMTVPYASYDAQTLTLHGVLPGISFPDVDKAGNPTPQHIAKFAEACRLLFYIPKMVINDWNETEAIQAIFKERLIFALSQSCEFYPAIYDRPILSKPIEITDKIINIGTSSYQHLNIGKSLESGKELYQLVISVVDVDRETRRPKPHPDWFKEMTKNASTVETMRVEKMNVPEGREGVLSYPYIVQESDTDYYQHVNQSKYFQICHNAASHFAAKGKFAPLHTNLSRMKLKSFQALYLGELEAGSEIFVRVWQDKNNPRKLNFDIVDAKTTVSSFQGSFEFTAELTPNILSMI